MFKKIATLIIVALIISSCSNSNKSNYSISATELEKYIDIGTISSKMYNNGGLSEKDKELLNASCTEKVIKEIENQIKNDDGDKFIDLDDKIKDAIIDVWNVKGTWEKEGYTDGWVPAEIDDSTVKLDSRIKKLDGKLGIYRKDMFFVNGIDKIQIDEGTESDKFYIELNEGDYLETLDEMRSNLSYNFEITSYNYYDNGLLVLNYRSKGFNNSELKLPWSNYIIKDGGRTFNRDINKEYYYEDNGYIEADREFAKMNRSYNPYELQIYMNINSGKVIAYSQKLIK